MLFALTLFTGITYYGVEFQAGILILCLDLQKISWRESLMKNQRVKKVFPGGNTSQGFHSFYHHIIPLDATRIFVMKGGPGVGKSTFMKTIAESLLAQGYSVEFHCCSSDNDSLDGIVIPQIGIAMIDGTAPHRIVTTINA